MELGVTRQKSCADGTTMTSMSLSPTCPRSLEVQTTSSLGPPLKWAGGKRWLLPYLRTFWSPERDRRLVEPFCGGLAVTLGLMPNRALLNDINPHLINFYRLLRRGFSTNLEMLKESNVYYAYRARFNKMLGTGQWRSRKAAALFYYLNRTCYNGLCRFNSRGEFNVPFGRHTNINYRMDFRSYQTIFSRFEFTNLDFAQVELEDDDFVYADPPYDVQFTSYSKDGFSWQDQERTASWLARHPGPTVISNQATDRIIDLYSRLGFELREVLAAPRMISCNGNRARAPEILATRNL